MNRCLKMLKALSLAAACFCLAPVGALLPAQPAQAQTQDPAAAPAPNRSFPPHTRRGWIQFVDPTHISLHYKIEQLAPGVRVYNEKNLIVLTNTLVGEHIYGVNYLRDTTGAIWKIWLLNRSEITRLPKGTDEVPQPSGIIQPSGS